MNDVLEAAVNGTLTFYEIHQALGYTIVAVHAGVVECALLVVFCTEGRGASTLNPCPLEHQPPISHSSQSRPV